MKVKDLIKQLKKMDQNLEVGIAAHDNLDKEVPGWVNSIYETEYIDFETEKVIGRCVVLRS